jgi:uncharacterized protein DUF5681
VREWCGFGPEAPETDPETGGAAPPVISGDNRRITGGEPPDNDDAPDHHLSPRDGSGRFAPGNAAGEATRFRRGRSGNPRGRPKGSVRAGTRAALAMADAASPDLMKTAIEQGHGGDGVAVRFVLARTMGLRRGQPVELDLPAVTSRADLGAAVAAITAAIGEGSLTPEEAAHLSLMLARLPPILAAVPPEPEPGSEDDPHERLIARLDRLAAAMQRRPKEERRAELLAQLAALDAEEAAAGGVAAAPAEMASAVAEDEEQDQHDQQQPADADPAAITVARVAITAAAEQQDQQHDQDDKAHGFSPFPARVRERASQDKPQGELAVP